MLGTARLGVAIVMCLTPITALIFLGWLTRKTARDIAARQVGLKAAVWPRFVLAEAEASGNLLYRLLGSLVANLKAGATAWLGALVLTLPFSLVWMVGWQAGWENSFNKGYEFAGLWPLVSLGCVFASLPVLVMLPMAIAHQAVRVRFTAIFEARTIADRIRRAGWRYLVLTLLIAIGGIVVLGARALPTFAAKISPTVVSGNPEAIAAFAGQFRLVMTALLVVGLLVIRRAMAWCYGQAEIENDAGRRRSRLSFGLVLIACGIVWLGLVFLIYVAQFLGYFWWNWINQPMLMLPWVG